jgi:cytochrome c peroxidase
MRIPSRTATRLPLFLCAILAACDRGPTTPDAGVQTPAIQASANSASAAVMAQVGGRIFRDKNLSLLRNQSCATCHDVNWGFSAPSPAVNRAGAVMPGSVSSRFGNRKPPSAAYATPSPVLYFDDVDGTYVGGNFWDGRATGERLGSPSAEQSQGPFVNPVEQALPDRACVVYRIARGSYASEYVRAFGRSIQSIQFPDGTNRLCERENVTVALSAEGRAQVDREYDRIALAIAAFENSSEVNRFSSKHDAYLARRAMLSPKELQGFALYVGKAGCAGCHPNAGERALFTDYTYDNIGVPANPANPAGQLDPSFRDLGIGGFRHEPGEYGKQKVPTLRNLDKRGIAGGAKSYMHNGVFKSLEQVVHFYNTRDVLPNCAAVTEPKFGVNCWPSPEVTENVNVDELGNLGLTPEEESAVVAYLKTLSDGYGAPVSVAGPLLAQH